MILKKSIILPKNKKRYHMIKEWIKKHKGMYRTAKIIQNMNNSEFNKMIDGYCYNSPNELSVLIHNVEYLSKNHIVYLIEYGVKDACLCGFFALLRNSIKYLPVAEHLGFVPKIIWGSKTLYYDHDNEKSSQNAFLYYFEPVAENVSIAEHPYILASSKDYNKICLSKMSYLVTNDDMRFFGDIYKKYIRLKEPVQKYIDTNVQNIIHGRSILGVHVRGTDFSQGWTNHPKIVTIDEYLSKAKELFYGGEYDGIFLATDDKNALDEFKNVFQEKLLYYNDVFRTENDIGPHETEDSRDRHHYKLGLEVLRDAYTLAHCKSLVCGLSQVSFAAQYINYALDSEFKKVIVIEHGINNKESYNVTRRKRELKNKIKIGRPNHK